VIQNSQADFIEAKVEVPRALADAVCNFVIENIANGLVLDEEDDSPVTGITFYVPRDRQAQYKPSLAAYLAEIIELKGQPTPVIQERLVNNVHWVDEYKASIRPLVIADDVVIRPSWAKSPIETKYEIILEPKMAFGTGSHETTRSCLKIIRKSFQPGMRFLDVGTGSGILSMLADKMGASYIKAIDYDIVAVENCAENFELNSVRAPHDILFGSIEKCETDAPYDFVCANIIRSTILPMLTKLVGITKISGKLVLSGLLIEDESEIAAALSMEGQADFLIVPDNKWISFVVTRR